LGRIKPSDGITVNDAYWTCLESHRGEFFPCGFVLGDVSLQILNGLLRKKFFSLSRNLLSHAS